MRVITLGRRPIAESNVAANVLSRGTGAIHINVSRISAPGEVVQTHTRSPEASAKENRPIYGEYGAMETHQTPGQQLGRWPANVILQHRAGCQNLGTREIHNPSGPASGPTLTGPSTSNSRGRFGGVQATAFHGKVETVAAWDCAPGCPVAALDAQAGPSGGVSRFYKQVKESNVESIPADLIEYLTALLAPSHLPDCKVLFIEHPDTFPWAEHPDASAHGIIAVTPAKGSPLCQDEMWRVLKPGGHLLLIAPDDERTGHTGACAIEDAGFEVRDALLLVQEPEQFHYVAKPPGKERHAGCEDLKYKRRLDEVLADEDLDPDDLAAAIAEAEASIDDVSDATLSKGNVHPTCKPKDMMARLLRDIPQNEGPVVDPFMGSGTTGLACLSTGHDFVGVEKETEYLEISDTRIRWWDRQRLGLGVEIRSDHKPRELPPVVQSLDDFFDL